MEKPLVELSACLLRVASFAMAAAVRSEWNLSAIAGQELQGALSEFRQSRFPIYQRLGL